MYISYSPILMRHSKANANVSTFSSIVQYILNTFINIFQIQKPYFKQIVLLASSISLFTQSYCTIYFAWCFSQAILLSNPTILFRFGRSFWYCRIWWLSLTPFPDVKVFILQILSFQWLPYFHYHLDWLELCYFSCGHCYSEIMKRPIKLESDP